MQVLLLKPTSKFPHRTRNRKFVAGAFPTHGVGIGSKSELVAAVAEVGLLKQANPYILRGIGVYAWQGVG
jgi:hypothetical protein